MIYLCSFKNCNHYCSPVVKEDSPKIQALVDQWRESAETRCVLAKDDPRKQVQLRNCSYICSQIGAILKRIHFPLSHQRESKLEGEAVQAIAVVDPESVQTKGSCLWINWVATNPAQLFPVRNEDLIRESVKSLLSCVISQSLSGGHRKIMTSVSNEEQIFYEEKGFIRVPLDGGEEPLMKVMIQGPLESKFVKIEPRFLLAVLDKKQYKTMRGVLRQWKDLAKTRLFFTTDRVTRMQLENCQTVCEGILEVLKRRDGSIVHLALDQDPCLCERQRLQGIAVTSKEEGTSCLDLNFLVTNPVNLLPQDGEIPVQGVGEAFISHFVASVLSQGLYHIELVPLEGAEGFYKKKGFTTDSDNPKAAMRLTVLGPLEEDVGEE